MLEQFDVKFIAANDTRITQEVDGHGLGFAHVGIEKIARSMGYGLTRSSYSHMPIHAPNGTPWPTHIGWLIGVK